MAFTGDFTPVLAKHSKSFSLIDCISVGVDRMQRNFEPMRKQVEVWQRSELRDVTAKVVIYEAFVEGKLEAPKHLARTVHDLYFDPKYEEFRSRTIWSLSNAFTSAFKELEPIPQFRATAKLGELLEARFSASFLRNRGGAGRTADPFITLFNYSLRAVVPGGRRSLPPQFHSPFRVSLRLADHPRTWFVSRSQERRPTKVFARARSAELLSDAR